MVVVVVVVVVVVFLTITFCLNIAGTTTPSGAFSRKHWMEKSELKGLINPATVVVVSDFNSSLSILSEDHKSILLKIW